MQETHIGKRVKRYRGKMTADELAERTRNPRITRSVIANIESGRRPDPTISQLLDISYALGVPLAALIVDVQAPYERTDLSNVGVDILIRQNIDLLNGILSPDYTSPEAADSSVGAIIRGLRALEELDADIYEQQLALRDREQILTDPELDAARRTSIKDGLAYAQRELERLSDRRETTEGLLRGLGVNLRHGNES